LPTKRIFFPSLTQLRAFCEVARFASISRASEELGRSQSAVTQAIQNLEHELGVTLFARTSAGSYLTEPGQILSRRANKCFSRMEASLRDIMEGAAADDARIAAIVRRITGVQIRALTAVHEHGSFTQAARYVDVAITSLQRSARSLEKQVGRALFATTPYGIRTNKTGAKLSGDLLLAVRELEWAGEEISSQKGALRGQLLVGSLLQAGNPFVTIGLDRFISTHADVKIKLTHGSYDELLTKLRSGSIDFLVGLLKNPPPANDVVEESLGSDPYVIVVRRTHPLARKKRITLSDLRSFEWIAPRPSAQRRGPFEAIFKKGVPPLHSVETHSLLTILVLLGSGDRIALMTMSEFALDRQLGNQLVALDYPVNETPAEIGVTTRSDWEPTRLQRTFFDFLRSQTDNLATSDGEPRGRERKSLRSALN
jgi:DNA-binding transcriptional LysR family regulator